MRSSKQLTIKDVTQIHSMARSIARMEKMGLSEREIKQAIYRMGVFAYRQYHDVGLPAETAHPMLSAPKKVWDDNSLSYVDERLLVAA